MKMLRTLVILRKGEKSIIFQENKLLGNAYSHEVVGKAMQDQQLKNRTLSKS